MVHSVHNPIVRLCVDTRLLNFLLGEKTDVHSMGSQLHLGAHMGFVRIRRV